MDQVQQQVPAGHGPLPGGLQQAPQQLEALQQNQQAPQQLEALQQNQQAPQQLEALQQNQQAPLQLQGLHQMLQELQQTVLQGQQTMEQQLQGLQQTMQGLQQTMQGVENRLEGVGNRLEGVENRLEGVEGEVRKLGHRTSPRLRQALQHNAHSFTTTSQLAVVPHPDTGEEPEDFPATNGGEGQRCLTPVAWSAVVRVWVLSKLMPVRASAA